MRGRHARPFVYVAATRAREALHLTGVSPISEFIDDMQLAQA